MILVLHGNPIGKPRMTQRDKWKQRPCVLAYRAWADRLRYKAYGKNRKLELTAPTVLIVRAYCDSGKTHCVGPHTAKPDCDNICKSIMDALFVNDHMVYRIEATKLWCDGGKPRVEVEWFT